TPKGPKRRALYGHSREEVAAKLHYHLQYRMGVDSRRHEEPETQDLYFIQGVDGGPIKIGIAFDVWGRFRDVQACSPVPLRMLHVVEDGGRGMES
ncbi:MAG: hypothetical protein WKF53_04080, partial [Rubrobacter sp.]